MRRAGELGGFGEGDEFAGIFSSSRDLQLFVDSTFSASNRAVNWDTTGGFSEAVFVTGECGSFETSSGVSTSTSAMWSREEEVLEEEP